MKAKTAKMTKKYITRGRGESKPMRPKESALYIETVKKIRELVSAEGDVGRAYAEAVRDHSKAVYLRTRGLKPTSGRVDLCRLTGKRARADNGYYMGWIDHPSLWIKDGKPEVFISQPYQLSLEDMRELIATCDAFGLEAMVDTWPSWHFPTGVLTIKVRKKGDDGSNRLW